LHGQPHLKKENIDKYRIGRRKKTHNTKQRKLMQHQQTPPVNDFNSFLHGAVGYFLQHCGVNGVVGKDTGSRKGAARVEVGGDERKVLTFDFTPVSKSVIRIFNVNYSVRVSVSTEDSQIVKWEYQNYTSNRRHFGLYNIKLNILFKEISVSFRPSTASYSSVDESKVVSCDFMTCLRNFFVTLPKVTSAIHKRGNGGGSDDCEEVKQ